MKTDKGVAGLTILLTLVTFLFVIGLLVTIFTLMGGELRDATYTSTTSTATNETVTGAINSTGTSAVTYSSLRNAVISVIAVYNDSTLVESANYTVNTSTGSLTNATAVVWDGTINVTYSYTYDGDNTATDTMNDTVTGLATTSDWFTIFIVIGAMVVLILLTVIIITAIRGSGLMAGESGA